MQTRKQLGLALQKSDFFLNIDLQKVDRSQGENQSANQKVGAVAHLTYCQNGLKSVA